MNKVTTNVGAEEGEGNLEAIAAADGSSAGLLVGTGKDTAEDGLAGCGLVGELTIDRLNVAVGLEGYETFGRAQAIKAVVASQAHQVEAEADVACAGFWWLWIMSPSSAIGVKLP